MLELVSKLFKLRNCSFVLSEENITRKKFRICLEYQVGNCLGPCEGLQLQVDYDASIQQIRQILKGNTQMVIGHLQELMKEHAASYRFEEAQAIKEKLDDLEKYQRKSVVVNPSIHNVDVFSIKMDGDSACVNFLRVMNGAIIQGHTVEMKKKLEESESELLELSIVD
ncbi:MAG: excinuclease ABC subunit C, partial [Flavobacteriales bacterium]